MSGQKSELSETVNWVEGLTSRQYTSTRCTPSEGSSTCDIQQWPLYNHLASHSEWGRAHELCSDLQSR